MSFEIIRGTNISHWLSQSSERGEERRKRFTNDDAKRIAGWGFDHIRIPVDEEQLWTRTMNRETEAFDLLGNGIEWALAAGLKVIVDLHIIRSHYFNDKDEPLLFRSKKEQKKLGRLWDDLSDFLKPWGNDVLAYELLNEAVAHDHAVWNSVYLHPYNAIRRKEPDRTIILGSNMFNQYFTYPWLKVPDDPRMILTFHYYHPMFLTHWKASWWRQGGSYEGPVNYPGFPIPEEQAEEQKQLLARGCGFDSRYFDASTMKSDISIPFIVARSHNLPLHCGEFGCYSSVPAELQKRWYRDLLNTFDEYGIAWTNWDFRGGFGLIDKDGNETAALEALRP
ncbi:MAG: cellulase family glycosylhydrolase [Spirochaetales bacterium]|nr:cellulase family glycosylhydrolase [Spirochaetales bacterium]